MRAACLLLLLLVPLTAEVKITYLANEGVLLVSGDSKVLIDALFRDSLGDYARHNSDTQERLESGKAPFDGIDIALATHYHLDHWDAGAITRFLRLNPSALFASTPQATGMMPRSQRERVRVLWGPAMEFGSAGIGVAGFELQHGETQNLGLRITMGDRVLVHLGDAEAVPVNFERLRKHKSPDVAMIPFWWLLDQEARRFVVEQWKPRHVVAIHFGATDAKRQAGKLRDAVPGIWLATRSGESRAY